MNSGEKIKICHLTSVHQATDNRIFFKECRTLAVWYNVVLIAPCQAGYTRDEVQVMAVNPPSNRIKRFLITDFQILFKALNQKAALYHIHDPELIIAGLALRLAGKKVIYDIEEDVRSDLREKKWLPFKSLFIQLFVLFESLAVRFFYLVLAEDSYSSIYSNRTNKFVVIRNFIPVSEVNRSKPYNPESNCMAFVGYLSARRGLPQILEALHILKKKGIIMRLKCVGVRSKAVNDILGESDAWKHVSDQVEFAGYIPFPDFQHTIEDCLAGLALPETLPNHIKSYPTKMFEYMALGLPVISSDFQFYKDVIDKYDCGLTVTPENPAQIADAMERLWKNKIEALHMSENGRNAVKYFDWHTEAGKLEDFYKKILE